MALDYIDIDRTKDDLLHAIDAVKNVSDVDLEHTVEVCQNVEAEEVEHAVDVCRNVEAEEVEHAVGATDGVYNRDLVHACEVTENVDANKLEHAVDVTERVTENEILHAINVTESVATEQVEHAVDVCDDLTKAQVEHIVDVTSGVTSNNVAIGGRATGESAVALGNGAVSSANGAVQLGSGTNQTADTLQFKNVQIVNSQGKIPAASVEDKFNPKLIAGETSKLTNNSDGTQTLDSKCLIISFMEIMRSSGWAYDCDKTFSQIKDALENNLTILGYVYKNIGGSINPHRCFLNLGKIVVDDGEIISIEFYCIYKNGTQNRLFTITYSLSSSITYTNEELVGGDGTVDTEMSDSSTNAVQNKVIKAYVDTKTANLPLIFNNLTVATTDFIADSTYAEFGYKAVITCPGVAASSTATVILTSATASLGIVATFCDEGTDTVTIYCKTNDTVLSIKRIEVIL